MGFVQGRLINLNDAVRTGTYSLEGTCLNLPVTSWGFLQVYRHLNVAAGAKYVVQNFYAMLNNNYAQMYSRIGVPDGSNGIAWQPWKATVSSGDFTQSLASTGYQKLPSGFIIQWGSGTFAASAWVTFPIAFPNICVHAEWNFEITGLGNTPRILNRTKSSFQMAMDSCCSTDQNNQPKSWFAIGY